jgi:hypothetical protein
MKIIDEVFTVPEGEEILDKKWEEREKEFESVSFYEMLLKFWKPLNSFYKTLGKK